MMMHYIYCFLPSFPLDEYCTLVGWAIDKWVLTYGHDVKERTSYLAERIQDLLSVDGASSSGCCRN